MSAEARFMKRIIAATAVAVSLAGVEGLKALEYVVIEGTLVERGERNLGVKHALFYVLLGAKMPAVLVESAFLSNPEEERELKNPAHQTEIAQRISQGVMRFLDQRTGFAAVP